MHEYLDIHETLPADAPTSARVLTIRRIFGLGEAAAPITLLEPTRVPTRGITLISGLSGSGKSTLLRRLMALRPDAAALPEIEQPNTPVVDLLGCEEPEAIRWMSLFGLGEARIMTTTFAALSDGQKVRARLALLMWRRPTCIVIDEFLSVLDRLTARIVAFNLQKLCRRDGVDAYLATAHADLVDALHPDHWIELELGGRARTEALPVAPQLPELGALEYGPGTAEDFRSLARYHYIEHLASEAPLGETEWAQSVSEVRVARHAGKVVAAAVFSLPVPQVLEQLPLFAALNQRALVVLRVIVHPLFRGVGLTKRLLQPELGPEVRCVVTCSALGIYFPFFLGAGFERCEHPRNLRYPEHDALDDRLAALSPGERFALNKYEHAQQYYDSLPEAPRAALRRLVSAICTRSNADYCEFVAGLVGIADERLPAWLRRFFADLVDRVPEEEFGTMVSEALYFPVQGFVRPVISDPAGRESVAGAD